MYIGAKEKDMKIIRTQELCITDGLRCHYRGAGDGTILVHLRMY